jgi:hypothetical protein
MLLMGVLCLGLGVWGAYDLWVRYPRMERDFARYQEASGRLTKLEEARQAQQERGTQPTAAETAAYEKATADLNAAMPGGKAPEQLSKYDKPFQWLYITCLPFAVPAFMGLSRVMRQRYRLDDEGALHFTGDKEHGAGVWSAAEIRDIDMDRWMRKSVAWVVRGDSSVRLKLDAYHHRHLEKIVGALASRFHPEQWDQEARPVKPKSQDEPQADAGGSENPVSAT